MSNQIFLSKYFIFEARVLFSCTIFNFIFVRDVAII